jgi:hypothetical protein
VLLSDEQRAAFARDGVLVVRDFYDVATDLAPIWRGIFDVIGLVADEHHIALDRAPFDATAFDAGYLTLKCEDRALASIVYDAVKQLAPFVRLVADPRHEALFRQLRGTDVVGIAGGGSGIRIDNPDEDQYRAWWHQEYPAQFRSLDGIVFWSPLRSLTPALGPVELLMGSHREGVLPVARHGEDAGRSGAYALRLEGEHELLDRYPSVAPLAEPGDLLLIDFLTVHRSGRNRASVPRWTMQMRYFNFADPVGRSIGWAGSFAAGNRIADVHPDLEVSR